MIIEALGVIYGLVFLSCYIPQLVKTLNTKNVEGLSLGMYLLALLGYILGIIYFIGSNIFYLAIALNFGGGLLACLFQISLILYYRK